VQFPEGARKFTRDRWLPSVASCSAFPCLAPGQSSGHNFVTHCWFAAGALPHVAAEFCDFGRIWPPLACIAVSRCAASCIQSRG
jgi:hypothetical protein